MTSNGYCVHGRYVGGIGADHICGSCEDGLCQHGRKVYASAWEDAEGCAKCGKAARPRLYSTLEQAQADHSSRPANRKPAA